MRRVCSIEGCERPHRARGWCAMHYKRWVRNGHPETVQYIQGDDTARFWSKVDRNGSGGCWVWLGTMGRFGYGEFWRTGQSRRAHRVAYELVRGPIPDGLHLDHLCRNRWCVNPSHLEPVTARENVLRSPTAPSAVNSRKTHCIQGHPFNDENTYWYQGERNCRECRRANWRRWDAKRRAA